MESCTQETPVNTGFSEDSEQNRIEEIVEQNKRNKDGSPSKKTNILFESFPWYKEFKEMCSCPDHTTSIKGLVRLIRVYIGYISREVASCQNKPSSACKIKQNLSRVLVFFNMRYKKLNLNFDESDYMDLMSQLLTMYLEIGTKTIRRGKESAWVTAKNTTSILFVMLHNCPDHIIDTLLKAEHLYKPRFKELFIPTFMKLIYLPLTTNLTYIRLLFIYKLWKQVIQDKEGRCQLNKLAEASLKPSPHLVNLIERGKFINILPKLLPSQDYSSPSKLTRFYMTTKFDLKISIQEFFKLTQWMKVYGIKADSEALENYDEKNLQPNLGVTNVKDEKFTKYKNCKADSSCSFSSQYANIPGYNLVPPPLRHSNLDSTMNAISIDLTQNTSENQKNWPNDMSNNVFLNNINKKPPKNIIKKRLSEVSFKHDSERFLEKLSLDNFKVNVMEPSSSLSNNTQIAKENTVVSQKTLLPNIYHCNSNVNYKSDCNMNPVLEENGPGKHKISQKCFSQPLQKEAVLFRHGTGQIQISLGQPSSLLSIEVQTSNDAQISNDEQISKENRVVLQKTLLPIIVESNNNVEKDSNINFVLGENSDKQLISNMCSSHSLENSSKTIQNNELINERSTINYDDVIPITGPPQCKTSVTIHEFNVPYTVNHIGDAMCEYELDLAVAEEVEVCSAQDGGVGELLDTVGVDNTPPARTPTPAESYVTAQSNNHKYELQQLIGSGEGNSPVSTIPKDNDSNLPLKKRRIMKTMQNEPESYSNPTTPTMNLAQLQLSTTTTNKLVQSKQKATQKLVKGKKKRLRRKATKRRNGLRKLWYLIMIGKP